MYAHKLKVHKIITKINRPTFAGLMEAISTASVISPKEIVDSKIISYLRARNNARGSNVVTLHKLVNNKVEALEFIAKENKKIDIVKTGTATYTTPVVNGTTISYSVGLTKPSDSVTLYFDVLNNGDVIGEITSIILSTPRCTSSTGNTADADLVCNNLEISLVYSDGSSVQVGDVIGTNDYRCLNGSTSSNILAKIELIVKLKDSMTSVPTSEVTFSNLKHDIIFSQTSKECKYNDVGHSGGGAVN
mgnify:CR=1 FL=1